MDEPRRRIRPFQDADEPAVAAVWHRSGLAAYPYLPTWQALTIEHARTVFHEVIRAECAIWVGTLDESIPASGAAAGARASSTSPKRSLRTDLSCIPIRRILPHAPCTRNTASRRWHSARARHPNRHPTWNTIGAHRPSGIFMRTPAALEDSCEYASAYRRTCNTSWLRLIPPAAGGYGDGPNLAVLGP